MQGPPTTFWGKLDREAGTWHPLVAHCADVAACAEALLETTLLRRRLATLGGRCDLDDVHVARLAVLAALHDIGKFNHGFQRKGDPNPKDVAGHVAEVLDVLSSGYEVEEHLLLALQGSVLAEWADDEGTARLLAAAIGHHGRPVPWGVRSPDPRLWTPAGHLDPFAGIGDLVAAARRWFPRAFSPAAALLPATPAFQHAFAGLVMLADWLGSDREFFPFAESLADRMDFARHQAKVVVSSVGLDTRAARARLGDERPGFERVSAFPPHEAQRATAGLSLPAAGGLTILESETGSGKTEAALCRFVQLAHANLVDGMVFALPTRTAATQLHGRVVEAVARAFADVGSRPPVVLAVPGYLLVDDMRGRRLSGFEVLWNDDEQARARHRGWSAEHPKRYLAGAIVVGTIDQVLLSALRVDHAHLRATALLRQLLVVDEVHASDVYMTRVLEEVLGYHLRAGGHALLMSATLGTAVRRGLERAALGVDRPLEPLARALETPYPVVHHAERHGAAGVVAIASPGRHKTVRVRLDPLAAAPDEVVRRALAAARAGARVLVLRNTVRDAVETQAALERLSGDGDTALLFRVGDVRTLHTARFTKTDREALDAAVEARLGKRAGPGGAVIVATQTVQQSLDLDADLILTDLAPMDVLLQRFGRLHRHAERDPLRPRGFEQATAVVLTSGQSLEACIRKSGEAQGPHGAGTVYHDLLVLEATRRRLERGPVLQIPADNRELVEVTTHPEALGELLRDLAPIWQTHANHVGGRDRAHAGLAGLNLVERHRLFGEYAFKEAGLSERISARLGESDRRAVFADPPPGPFGAPVRELTLPGWLAKPDLVPADPELAPTKIQPSGAGESRRVGFAFGALRLVYDRLGLRVDDARDDLSADVADA